MVVRMGWIEGKWLCTLIMKAITTLEVSNIVECAVKDVATLLSVWMLNCSIWLVVVIRIFSC